ncbi:MAG: GNAT family N-acetyltransferase [Eubacterium sp.]|nr:GNAT family N-acetyltransferase [Eubacterium sp.]
MNSCIRYADKQDIPILVEMWKSCFSDSEEYIRYFYKENFDNIEVLVNSVNGKPVSMAHIINCSFVDGKERNKGKFIYAVGTSPDYRNRGSFTGLMRYITGKAKEKGYALFLKPSEPGIELNYKKAGFERDSVLRIVTFKCEGVQPIDVSPLSYKEYNKMRDAAFSDIPYVKWDDEHVKWCVEENEYFSGRTLRVAFGGKSFFLMGYRENGTLIINETDLSFEQLKLISGSLCREFETELIKAYLPDRSCNKGEEVVSSLVYNLPHKNTYANLILI